MGDTKKLWISLLGSTAIVALLGLAALDQLGIGPNLGLPFGYFGRLNRILARIEAAPELEVSRVVLHRDATLEDFYVTVRTPDEGEVELTFEGAAERPVEELLQELGKVGL